MRRCRAKNVRFRLSWSNYLNFSSFFMETRTWMKTCYHQRYRFPYPWQRIALVDCITRKSILFRFTLKEEKGKYMKMFTQCRNLNLLKWHDAFVKRRTYKQNNSTKNHRCVGRVDIPRPIIYQRILPNESSLSSLTNQSNSRFYDIARWHGQPWSRKFVIVRNQGCALKIFNGTRVIEWLFLFFL